ncbi:MAG: ABC transporter substrate-binding protein [Pyramidobacter sp.]|nr:ABC transporter substrate-binding protein [Pyramidobacter sp.]
MDHFHVSATGLSINYLPEYVARELGFFKDVGIEVTSSVPTDWTQVLRDVDSGAAQAALGGIWVPSIYKQHGVKDYAAFAKVSSRCPMVLVARASGEKSIPPAEEFDWHVLENRQILCPGGNGISPYMFLAGCMREHGVDMSTVRWIHDFTAGMLLEGFRCGWGDVVVLPPHMAATLYEAGKGYELCDLARHGGDVPWSVYYGLPEFVSREDSIAGRFTLALQRGTQWVLDHDASCCADLLKRNWPKVSVETLVAKVNYLREVGMWTNALIGEREYTHYEEFMVHTGIIDEPLTWSQMVDSRPWNYACAN